MTPTLENETTLPPPPPSDTSVNEETTRVVFKNNTADEPVSENSNPRSSRLTNIKFRFPHPGVLFALTSATFYSLCSLLVKRLDRYDPSELATIRFVGILIPSITAALRQRHHLFPAGHRPLLVLRALLGTTSLICKFYALRNMSLADASVILLSVPVFTAIFARIFLREPCGWLHGTTITLTVAGMVLITRPPALFGPLDLDIPEEELESGNRLLGSLMAITSTMFGASVYVAMRKLRSVPPTVIMTNFSGLAAPLALCVCLGVGDLRVPESVAEGGELVALAVCSFLGNLCLTRACRLEEAGLVAIVRTIVEVLLAVLMQVLQFGEVPTPLTFGGMSLVTFSVLLVGLKKWVSGLSEDRPLRRRLAWLV